jgi:two-component system chemotaxis response regulator CheY
MQILFVDDSKLTRAVMGQLLRHHQHDVFTAADAEEAKELIRTESFDLIITDLNMPGTDGLAFTRWIREQEGLKNVPIMLMTADFEPGATAEAKQAGVNLFVEKTFSPEEMAEAIEKVAERLEQEHKGGGTTG